MSSHERDVLSLMGGLLLVLVAVVFLVDDTTGLSLDGRWVAPGLLVAVGVAGLAASVRRAR